jgi:acetoacetate decarboxylase
MRHLPECSEYRRLLAGFPGGAEDLDQALGDLILRNFTRKRREASDAVDRIAMTRPVELGKGGMRKQAGSRFVAHATSHGRRVISASVMLEKTTERAPRAITLPLVHTRLFPAIDRPEPAVHELAFGTIAGFEHGAVHEGAASLELGATEYEELLPLAPRSLGRGYVFSLAFSVLGGRVEQP